MLNRTRLYRYTHDGLLLEEARWARTRLTFIGALVGAILLVVGLEVNQYYDDALGIGFTRNAALISENRTLKEQLRYVASRVEKLQKGLRTLGEQDNELRLRMDLPRLDADVLKAGVGGIDERVELGTSPDASKLLTSLGRMVGSAEGELHLQLKSYSDVDTKFEQDKVRFSHLPATKPMIGFNTRNFGMRLHPILGVYKPHEGLDIISDQGTPVYVTADGTVQFTGRESGLGIAVMVNHGYSVKTIYGHLSKILVHEGQQVKRGDLIARSGNTGLSTGPHLHYEVRVNGVAQNPMDYFFDDVLRIAQER
jgi:murein DD-endopeptidase MepM/ murein hydrolase activator NlpD